MKSHRKSPSQTAVFVCACILAVMVLFLGREVWYAQADAQADTVDCVVVDGDDVRCADCETFHSHIEDDPCWIQIVSEPSGLYPGEVRWID